MSEALSWIHITVINVFIVVYLFIAWGWDLPDPSFLRRITRVPFVRWLGLWYTWKLFAPKPINYSRELGIELYMENGGTVEACGLPETEFATRPEMTRSRHRKLVEHLISTADKTNLRESYCYYLVHHSPLAHMPIKRVKLYATKCEVAAPGTVKTPKPSRKLVYSYRVFGKPAVPQKPDA
jgi:hypothetical protein